MSARPVPALILAALATIASVARGDVVDFNDLTYKSTPPDPLPGGSTGTYDNGFDLPGSFASHGATFNNSYGTYSSGGKTVDYWGGWSYSNVQDPTRTGPAPPGDPYYFTHQYGAVPGSGVGGPGNNYGVGFVDAGNPSGDPTYINLPRGAAPASFYVTNTNYAYLVETLGNPFASPLVLGDYVTLQVTGYSGLGATGTALGTVSVDLARINQAGDTPLDSWKFVDLTPLDAAGGVLSLGFNIVASQDQYGDFGLNTPAYFAMDDLTLGAVPEPAAAMMLVAGLLCLVAGRRLRRTRP